jgi:hypothetical protein
VSFEQREMRRFEEGGGHCRLCGGLLPRTVWRAEVGGAEHDFCDAECEELYRTYWLPRYGSL